MNRDPGNTVGSMDADTQFDMAATEWLAQLVMG